MTGPDLVLALVAGAAGVACLVAVLRMTSGLGRLGLLLVLVLAVLVGLGVQVPSWREIADYLAPTPTEVNP
jgi:hypothetical protein